MTKRPVLFACILLSVSLVPRAYTATFYTAKNGNDSNLGTISSPFATINKGVGVLEAGDTLYIRGGTYVESLTGYGLFPSANSWENAVTITAYNNEEVNIRPGSGYRVLMFVGTQYVIIKDIIVDATGCTNAIDVTWGGGFSAGHHIRFDGCEIKNANRQGFLINDPTDTSGYCQILNSSIHDNGTTDFDHGIYIHNDHHLIQGCEIYSNAGWGVHIYHNESYPRNTCDYNTVKGNRIHDNGAAGNRGPGIGLYSGTGNIAYNNLIWNNQEQGIIVDYGAYNTKIYNNTIYSNSSDGIRIGRGTETEIKNNIVYNNTRGTISNSGTNTITSNNLTTNPGFVDALNEDFHLQTGSSAIDAGTTLGDVIDDFDGKARPQGSDYDIGAYEYGGDENRLDPPRRLVILDEADQ